MGRSQITSHSLPLNCIQFHFICPCSLAWQYDSPLKITVYHHDDGYVIAHLFHNSRHDLYPSQFAGSFSSMPGDDFIKTILQRPYDCRDKNTDLTNTGLYQSHFFIITNCKWMIIERQHFAYLYHLNCLFWFTQIIILL